MTEEPTQPVEVAEPAEAAPRRTWVEPTVRLLAVSETAAGPGTGGDGATPYPDCTKS